MCQAAPLLRRTSVLAVGQNLGAGGGFADPERSDTEGGAALLGGETQKERHLLKADVFLFGASVLIAFTLINSNKIGAQRSGSQLERGSKGAGG